MKRIALLSAGLWLLASSVSAQTVYLVRLAESAARASDSPLSTSGEQRAQALAEQLHGVDVDLALASPAFRAGQMASLATNGQVVPDVVGFDGGNDGHIAEVVERVRARGRDDVILVVDHSPFLPSIAKALGYAEAADMPACEYDRLMVLRLSETGAQSEVRRFGAPSQCSN